MAAAYAALLSLSHILHQILHPPPAHQFVLPTEQIRSLQDQVSSIISFFEKYSKIFIKEIEDLENRIVGAVYKAEDVIESDVVRQILAKFDSRQEVNSFALLCRRLQLELRNLLPIQKMFKNAILKVIQNFGSIQRVLDEIKSRKAVENVRLNVTGASSSRSLPSGKNIMVGFDEHMEKIRRDLVSDHSTLLIVPIVGMGGIGKTTLATNVYKDAYIIQRFDVCAWVSVSQEYKEQEILITLLQQINSVREVDELSVDEMSTRLYQELYMRRYLIVLDDMWDRSAWETLRSCLPDNNNGSRILVTTRLQQLATDFGSCKPYNLSLLDEEKSWELVHEYVCGDEKCSNELEEIGRSIARKCGGLPLALAVIGGLLAKSEKTVDFWEYINKNVTSAAKQAHDSHCIHILRLSFSELPIHLKPCFLHLAVFPKNIEMRRSKLIRLWVAEGFIKATGGHSLEEVGEGYLEDLFDRNLVMISKRGNIRKVKSCSIHDLIRELCMEEAQKNKFLCIAKLENSNMSPDFDCERRLSIHAGIEKEKEKGVELRAGKHNRSFFNYSAWERRRRVAGRLNLLRVLDVVNSYSIDDIMWLINSRYITCGVPWEFNTSFLISLPWNLQTLILPGPILLPSEFWQMTQLRHLKMPEITMADPSNHENVVKLENLQTLSMVKDFKLSNNVLRRIPNLKKLGINCETTKEIGSLSNLASLLKLESLALKSRGTWENMAFPDSLKKLELSCCQIPWKDMSVIGSLPNLEVLKLRTRAAEGKVWKPNEGEFCRLKLLLIDLCQLEILEADDRNFPSLERVQLIGVKMEEFPIDFAQIETLRSIDLRYCRESLYVSANRMSENRENFGYEAIEIQSFPKEIPMFRENKNVVGFDGEANTVIGYLTEETEELEVVSIIGMPGLGKTTLAWKIYCDPRIQFEFPTLIWIYVSQEYNIKEVFVNILKKFTQEDMSRLDENELARKVKFYLEKLKFLLFMDDVWTGEAWGHIEAALPKSNKFGKVLITSRDEKVAWEASKREPHKLGFLEPKDSWELLQLEVFARIGECPRDLEVLGKDIAKQCGGVPLAIVVIGGILVQKFSSSDINEAWKKVSDIVSSHINNSDKLKCIENIILLSYNKLPYNLRDCFLYLGMFPEDSKISAWKLTRLWIAEGFIQQTLDKSFEEVAEEYLEELILRNLVMVDKTNAKGGVKTCHVHDMIHVFCKTQAAFAKQNLFQVVKRTIEGTFYPPLSDITKSTRLCIHSNVVDFLLRGKPKCPFVRSFLCFSKEAIIFERECIQLIPKAFNLLRVLDCSSSIRFTIFPYKMITQLFDLRYIAISCYQFNCLPESVFMLSNLQTIRIDTLSRSFVINADLRKMMQLRHLKTKAAIIISKEAKAGENLQTLSRLSAQCCCNFFFNEAPNLKNLGIRGQLSTLMQDESLAGLDRLQKLKLVYDVFPEITSQLPLRGLPSPEKFPPNLKILKLSCTFLEWKHMATLGSLPSLEVLKLKENAFMGKFWNVGGGSFPSLEVLMIARTDLEFWTATNQPFSPFPKLRSLVLKNCERLEEIPSMLEESLQNLDIERVTKSIVQFARDMDYRKQQISNQRGKRGGFKLRIAPGDGR